MNRGLLFVFSCILAVGAIYFLIVRQPAPNHLELLPPNCSVVLEWESPARSYHDLLDSRFGKQLREIDWPLIMNALGVTREEQDFVHQVSLKWEAFSQSPFFRKILGKRSTFALLSQPDDEPLSPISLLKRCIFLNKGGRRIALWESLVAKAPGARKLPTENYQGYIIHGYQWGNEHQIYYVTDKELLIAAFDTAPIQQCLDLLLARIIQKGGAIADKTDFMRLKKRTGGLDDFFLYVDVPSLKGQFQQLVPGEYAGPGNRLAVSWHKGSEIKTVALYHQFQRRVHQVASIIRFAPSGLSPFQREIYRRSPVYNRKIANMPGDILLYFWSNWLDLSAWWQEEMSNAADTETERIRFIQDVVERYTGMPMEDFLMLFGEQAGLNIKEIKESRYFPVPRFYFSLQLNDRQRTQIMLEKLIAGLPVRRNKVTGVEVVSILAAGGLMQPSYALLDNYLVLADGRDQIEDILRPTKAMLIDEPDFVKVDVGLQKQNNLILFARTVQLIDGLKKLVSWLGSSVTIYDGQDGVKSKILIDEVIDPLLDGLMMFDAMAVRSYTAEEEFVLQSAFLTTGVGSRKKNQDKNKTQRR